MNTFVLFIYNICIVSLQRYVFHKTDGDCDESAASLTRTEPMRMYIAWARVSRLAWWLYGG